MGVMIKSVRGLHRISGAWACTVGIFRPMVMIDPMAEAHPGGNAMIIHECVHAREKHALRGILVLILTLGLGYKRYRRRCEVRADAAVFRTLGEWEFRSMLQMCPPPTTRWGQYIYGSTLEFRFMRAKVFAEENVK